MIRAGDHLQGDRIAATARRQPAFDALVAEIVAARDQAVALVGEVKDEAFAKALLELSTGRFGAWT